MPTRLKQVKVREGSLVDEPANPRARVVLLKRDEPEAGVDDDPEALDKAKEKPMKTENGVKFPAEAYAYVPDPEKPSTWKLRLWETPEKKETPRQVGMAVAALGPGFRGNKVEIPPEDLPKVIRRVREAWLKVHPNASEEDLPEVLRKGGEAAAMSAPLKLDAAGLVRHIMEALDKAVKEVLKQFREPVAKADQEAMGFGEILTLQEAEAELWDYIHALQQSIRSILRDSETSPADKEALIRGSLDQFVTVVEAAVPNWLAAGQVANKVGRKIAADRLRRLKEAWETLGAIIREAEEGNAPAGSVPEDSDNQAVAKGEDDAMTIDKSKLPEDARPYVDQLEKRIAELEQELAKAKGQAAQTDDELLKSLPEPLRKRLEEAERRAKEAEELAKAEREARLQREYIEKARAYSNVGKPEDLAVMLRKAYDIDEEFGKQLETVLRAANERISQGALFAEVGKGGPGAGSAEAEIEAKAVEMVAKGLAKSKAEAVAKVVELYPDLAKRYHEERHG